MIATFTDGGQEANFPVSRHRELLDDLVNADAEHPDVALTDESGWTIVIFASGRVLFENIDEVGGDRLFLRNTTYEEQLQLLEWLDGGKFDMIQALAWDDE